MNIIAFRSIREFYEKHAITEEPLRSWYSNVKYEEWNKPQDVVACFGSSNVDILKNDRVCINIKGDNLRIVIRINYKSKTCFIRWIGWHKDYDKLGDKIHSI